MQNICSSCKTSCCELLGLYPIFIIFDLRRNQQFGNFCMWDFVQSVYSPCVMLNSSTYGDGENSTSFNITTCFSVYLPVFLSLGNLTLLWCDRQQSKIMIQLSMTLTWQMALLSSKTRLVKCDKYPPPPSTVGPKKKHNYLLFKPALNMLNNLSFKNVTQITSLQAHLQVVPYH